jgi:hypothetical protein
MCGPRELWLSVWLSVWLSMYEAEEGMSGQQQESRLIWLRKTDDNLLTKEGNDAVLISWSVTRKEERDILVGAKAWWPG